MNQPPPLPSLNSHYHRYRRTEFKVALSVGLAFFILMLGFWFATREQGDTAQTATPEPAQEQNAQSAEPGIDPATPEAIEGQGQETESEAEETATTAEAATTTLGPTKLNNSMVFESDSACEITDAPMETKIYEDAVYCDSGSSDSNSIEFVLNRQYKTLRGTLGAHDSNPSDGDMTVEIVTENENVVYSQTFVLGSSEQIEIDVSGALRIKFRFPFDTGWYHGFVCACEVVP